MSRQSLLETLAPHLAEGLLLVAADRTLTFASPRAIELLGLPPSWPRSPLASLRVDYRLALTVTSCFDHGHPVERSLSGGGRGRDTVIRALPIGSSRPVDEVAVVLHDESELRRLQVIRRDFTANVSHELRTPATAIKLMVETLQSGALQDPEATAEFVARIGQEAAHMARMIEELLELSAMESDRRIRHPEPVPLAGLLTSLDRLRPLADDRGVAITMRFEPTLPAVLGEPLRLGQMLRNLVHNAIKFSPRGGEVVVQARSESGSLIAIEVSDRGPGIPAADLSRVFERFWKGDASRQRDGEGSGLGLAIARHIAEGHGGSISAQSEPGRGSTFTVLLPAAASTRPG